MSLETIKLYLNKPFPFFENRWQRFVAVVLISVFIFGFLFIFQPFGLANVMANKIRIIAGYALVTFLVLLVTLMFLPEIDTHYFEKWNIKKNFIFILLHFIIIALFNWIYNHNYFENQPHYSLWFFILITISVGIFPSFLLVYFIEKWLSKNNEEIASTINNELSEEKETVNDTKIEVISKNNNENFSILLCDFICIKSEGNYINVCFMNNDELNNRLIRNSISVLEEHLSEIRAIIRCHRSYLVNLNKVEHVSGNAHSLSLHFRELDNSIPVSRSFPKEKLLKYKRS